MVGTVNPSIVSNSDLEIRAVGYEEYCDVLEEDISRASVPLNYMFEPLLVIGSQ